MKLRHGRRVAALLVMGCVAGGSLVVAANAESTLDAALSSRQDLHGRIKELHGIRNQKRVTIHKRIRFYQARIDAATKAKVGVDRGYEHWKKKQVKAIERLRAEEKAVVASIRGRVSALREQRATLADWIEALPLQRCPVDGPVEVSDNFGDVRDMPGTPYHIHQGNDMMAATGTPIVAPFDGTAVANPGELGGQAVDVYGVAGHVYNAHLSAYGKLGPVHTGDIIGYVGSTGNATAPHDHFEWHPNDGAAVDPYDLLMTVC